MPFPYGYYGDTVSLVGSVRMLKQLLATGSVYLNPLLAAPFGQDSHDVPALYAIDYAIQRALVLLTRDPFLSYNLFYLLCPVLDALAALYALRRLGVRSAAAIPCAILYGNLYEVYWRTGHPFVAAYYAAPLACLVALNLSLGEPLFRRTPGLALTRSGWIALAIGVLVGLQSHYEVFFSCTLVVAGAIIGALQLRSVRPIVRGTSFCAVAAVSFLVNLAPSLVWQLAHGSNSYATVRRAEEAIVYALSIGQLVLPIPDHRIPLLAFWRSVYDGIVGDAVTPSLINENMSATLGLVATLGLIGLVAKMIARPARNGPRLLENAALLVTSAIAVGTIGGLGALFNVAITAQVRNYNRISTFIAFLCLLAVARALERLHDYANDRGRPGAYVGFAACMVAFGVFDQSPANSTNFALSRARLSADAAFSERIAAVIPRGAAVLELPYVVYPDMPGIGHVEFVPSLFSDNLRWSVGAVGERSAVAFESWIAALPPGDLLAASLLAGFDGILVFRDGIPDRGAAVEGTLRAAGLTPVINDDGSRAFYPILGRASPAARVDPSVGTPAGLRTAIELSARPLASSIGRLKKIAAAVLAPKPEGR